MQAARMTAQPVVCACLNEAREMCSAVAVDKTEGEGPIQLETWFLGVARMALLAVRDLRIRLHVIACGFALFHIRNIDSRSSTNGRRVRDVDWSCRCRRVH